MKTLLSILVGLAILTNLCRPAIAISPEQKRVIDSGAGGFDVEDTVFTGYCSNSNSTAGSNSNALVGSQNGEKVWNFFIGQGLRPPQVAGVMGNLEWESGLNPRRVEGTISPAGDSDSVKSYNKGYGLAQWTFGRQKGLMEIARARGTIDGHLGTQLDFIMQEFQESGNKSWYNELRGANNVDQASDIVMLSYERPRDQSENAKQNRRNLARATMTQYGSSAPPPSSDSSVSTSCQTGGKGEAVKGYSLPVDRRIYDDHPGWFSAPHHNYPASDIPVPAGTSIYSMSDGKIISAPAGGGCGTGVIVDAGSGVVFTYCHGTDGGSIPGANQGDTVKAGQLIMHSGSTGESTGPHVHVQIDTSGTPRCPQPLFKGIADGSPPDPHSLPTTGCTS